MPPAVKTFFVKLRSSTVIFKVRNKVIFIPWFTNVFHGSYLNQWIVFSFTAATRYYLGGPQEDAEE